MSITNNQPNRSEEFGSVSQAPSAKLEGTSVTYGQDIRMPDESIDRNVSNAASPLTPQATPSGDPSSIPTGKIDVSTPDAGSIARIDTVVKVIEKVEETLETACGVILTRLTPNTKSNVAVAAASTNKSATVVVSPSNTKFVNLPPTTFQQSGLDTIAAQSLPSMQKSITGALLANVATVTPNVVKMAVVVGSEIKTKKEIRKALEEAQKVDLTIALKSKDSESIDFNTVKVPNMESLFVYNFFREGEEDIERQEDPLGDPLLKNKPKDVPKYTKLDWSAVWTTEPITGTELEFKKNEEFRSKNFFEPKGVAGHDTDSVPNSTEKAKKKVALLQRDGLGKTIVDIHSQEEGFAATANSVVFANSVAVTVAKNEESEIVSLPIIEIETS